MTDNRDGIMVPRATVNLGSVLTAKTTSISYTDDDTGINPGLTSTSGVQGRAVTPPLPTTTTTAGEGGEPTTAGAGVPASTTAGGPSSTADTPGEQEVIDDLEDVIIMKKHKENKNRNIILCICCLCCIVIAVVAVVFALDTDKSPFSKSTGGTAGVGGAMTESSGAPTAIPTTTPTSSPTTTPTTIPTLSPTTPFPTTIPTFMPTESPTDMPTESPTDMPSPKPTVLPTESPTSVPTESPSVVPTESPSVVPTESPTDMPTKSPTELPTYFPTIVPTAVPTTADPTAVPTLAPTTPDPTAPPTPAPIVAQGCTGMPDGEHTLVGSNSGNSYSAYCSGGFTLVGRAHGDSTNWSPISSLWHDASTLNPTTYNDFVGGTDFKGEGWSEVVGNAMRICWNSHNSNCATFTHNLNITPMDLYTNHDNVEIVEDWNFVTLSAAFGGLTGSWSGNPAGYWCGINYGTHTSHSCNFADAASINAKVNNSPGTIGRLGCIGDGTGNRNSAVPDGGCLGGPDDHALGVGISSCEDGGTCNAVHSTWNLHSRPNGWYQNDNAWIYVG